MRTVKADLVIAGGTEIDPIQGLQEVLDVIIVDGKITGLVPPGKAPRAVKVVDAKRIGSRRRSRP